MRRLGYGCLTTERRERERGDIMKFLQLLQYPNNNNE
jgi:hypothetical protein